jgi:hypothetical protein
MFTFFSTMESTKPSARDWTWMDFVNDVMSGHKIVPPETKPYCWHFNASTYKKGGRRVGSDIETVNAIILDFDDYVEWQTTIAAFAAFRKLEFVAYTSFNHQRSKGESDRARDKFRIVFPFKTSCTVKEYQEISDYLLTEFAPKADRCLGNPNQIFTYVYCAEENAEQANLFYNEGEWLDWRTLPRTEAQPAYVPGVSFSTPSKADHYLPADHIFQLGKGLIRFGDVKSRIGRVYCPHHPDKSPGSFLNKTKNTIYHHCSKCGTTKIAYEEPKPEDVIEAAATRSAPPVPMSSSQVAAIQKEILGISEDDPVEPFSRERRVKLIERRCMTGLHEIMLLQAFEGFGKSYYAVLEARRGNKVLFASSSNEQAAEQASSFEKLGLRVQLIPGREYLLRTLYKVEVQKSEETHPWDLERLSESKTKKWIMTHLKKTVEEAEKIWLHCTPPQADFVNYDIVCTTIARTQSFGKIQRARASLMLGRGVYLKDEERHLPKDCIVFFDDPEKTYFTKYAPYDEKYIKRQQEKKRKKIAKSEDGQSELEQLQEIPTTNKARLVIDGVSVKETTINGTHYFIRPDSLKLGYGLFDARLVFTTTELITTYLIKDMYPKIYHPKLMPDQKMLAGEITMIKSNLAGAKRDAFLRPILARLKKEGFECELIADGIGAKYNLLNSKGQNQLAESTTVIKLSEPHFEEVKKYIDELNWDPSDAYQMKLALALDKLQQAIGRNSGYRWSDREGKQRKCCYVVCEPRLHDDLLKAMRYHVETIVLQPSKEVGSKKDYQNLRDGLCWFIAHLDRYLMMEDTSKRGEGRDMFWSDIQTCFEETQTLKRVIFKRRLLEAIKTKIEKTKEIALSNALQKRLQKLGE